MLTQPFWREPLVWCLIDVGGSFPEAGRLLAGPEECAATPQNYTNMIMANYSTSCIDEFGFRVIFPSPIQKITQARIKGTNPRLSAFVTIDHSLDISVSIFPPGEKFGLAILYDGPFGPCTIRPKRKGLRIEVEFSPRGFLLSEARNFWTLESVFTANKSAG